MKPSRRAPIGEEIGRPRTAFAVAMFMIIPGALLLVAGPASADSVTVMGATLPTPRYGTSAVWDGASAYIFGGVDNSQALSEIVRYNTTTDSRTTMIAALPTPRYLASAVWDGANAYIFGGYGNAGPLSEILQYNTTTDTITPMTATLPTPLYYTSAVWDGAHAYIFGGGSVGIVQYNTTAHTVATMTATLPTGRSLMSAVWDGANAYVFGGIDNSGLLSEIVQFNTAADAVAVMTPTLPTGRYITSAVWDGADAYIFGGSDLVGKLSEIVRYSPTSTDTTPPNTFIDSATDGNGAAVAASGSTVSTSLTLAFHGTDDVAVTGYQCSLDSGAYSACTSPKTFAGLASGAHTIRVRAMDGAGNVDATPASFSWTVLTPAQAIQRLIDKVQSLPISKGTKSSLTSPLVQAKAKLTDANLTNDLEACGKLQNFLNLVQVKRANGSLTNAQADTLRDAAVAIRTALGC